MCIVLKCDVSKLIEDEGHTHSNIHGGTPKHEIIVHHWRIIIPSVSMKALARRCADDFEGQSVVNPASNSSMSIGIIYIPLFGQLSGQSVDEFCGMNAESAICSHHEGFEGPTNILCRQSILADLLRLMIVKDNSERTSFDVGRAIHVGSLYIVCTSSNTSRPSISSNPAIPKSARSPGSPSFEGRISHGSRMTKLGKAAAEMLPSASFVPDYVEQWYVCPPW
jgi:hypothetical protein